MTAENLITFIQWFSAVGGGMFVMRLIDKYIPQVQKQNMMSETYKNMLEGAGQSLDIMKQTADEMKETINELKLRDKENERKIKKLEYRINKEVQARKECMRVVQDFAKKNGLKLNKKKLNSGSHRVKQQ